MDEALRQYQLDIRRANLSRRRFLTLSAMGAASAALAACSSTPGPSASAAASATSAPSTAPSAAPSVEPTTAPFSYAPTESEMFLFNWSDYFSPDNQKAFEEQFGITNSVRHLRVQRGAAGQAPGRRQGRVRRRGPDRRVRRRRWPRVASSRSSTSRGCRTSRLNKQFLGLPSDPNDEYLVPKDWGTTGIIYRGKDVKEPVTSWKDFFDLATTKYSGKTFVVNSPGDVFVAPLAMHGFDVNTDEQGRARDRPHGAPGAPAAPPVDRLGHVPQTTARRRRRSWVSPGTARPTCSSRRTPTRTPGTPSRARAPSSGRTRGSCWPMPRTRTPRTRSSTGSRTRTSRSSRACSRATPAATTSAKPLLPPDFVGNPAVYVPDSELSRLSVSTDQSGNQQRADIWAEFSAG